jgi:hypothetical protein
MRIALVLFSVLALAGCARGQGVIGGLRIPY